MALHLGDKSVFGKELLAPIQKFVGSCYIAVINALYLDNY